MAGKRLKEEEHKGKGKVIAFFIIILIFALLGAGYYYFEIYNKAEVGAETNILEPQITEDLKPEQESIFSGDERPIAVMIDNHKGAWPQAGLNEAYSVYEIIVEGGETRLMALFKGVDLEKIGPVRSSRHYFLDYALENDAIYAHYGWKKKKKTDISKLDVDNINGITESSSSFWRTKSKAAPHNVFTSTKKIKEIAENKGYSLTSDEESVLNYTFDEVNLEDGIDANTVTIPYSDLHTTSYKYDAETKRYVRYARGKKQTDYETKDPITTKNIIITFVENSRLNDGTKKDRQTIDNIGTCNGYYITNGKAIKIKCTKDSRKKQTVYKDLDGNEIEVNDGNRFFNICPIDSEVTFE